MEPRNPFISSLFQHLCAGEGFSVCIKDSVFIDPPYNTGSAFEHYDDNFEHSIWLNLIRPRLSILWNLLHETEGSIWISIDDAEQAYIRVLCDELFGRHNFIAQIVW